MIPLNKGDRARQQPVQQVKDYRGDANPNDGVIISTMMSSGTNCITSS
ncbi:MAG: hypothetical protein ACLTXH_07205 [Enterobacter hormaechei]